MINPDGNDDDGNAYQLHSDEQPPAAGAAAITPFMPQLQLENPLSTLTGSSGAANPSSHEHENAAGAPSMPPPTTHRFRRARPATAHALDFETQHHHLRHSQDEVVVIGKSYYMSHSLRYPPLFKSGKPASLRRLSSVTWHDLQVQLGPLLQRQLFLPKSYLFVPLLCLAASMGWFVCFSIATATNNTTTNGQSMTTLQQIYWMLVFLVLLGGVWCVFARWVHHRNQPIDDELRALCHELSRHKTQTEGYRLEYHQANTTAITVDQSFLASWMHRDVFATRVLRFVPLPVPRKITVVQQTNTTLPTESLSNSHSQPSVTDPAASVPAAVDLEAPLPKDDTTTTNNANHKHIVDRRSSAIRSSSEDETASEYSTLQALSAASQEFHPFPVSDRLLENLGAVLFVLILFQCIHSLP